MVATLDDPGRLGLAKVPPQDHAGIVVCFLASRVKGTRLPSPKPVLTGKAMLLTESGPALVRVIMRRDMAGIRLRGAWHMSSGSIRASTNWWSASPETGRANPLAIPLTLNKNKHTRKKRVPTIVYSVSE
jgi:hypothetical protein